MDIHITVAEGEKIPRIWEVICSKCCTGKMEAAYMFAIMCPSEDFAFGIFSLVKDSIECERCGGRNMRIREKKARGASAAQKGEV